MSSEKFPLIDGKCPVCGTPEVEPFIRKRANWVPGTDS